MFLVQVEILMINNKIYTNKEIYAFSPDDTIDWKKIRQIGNK